MYKTSSARSASNGSLSFLYSSTVGTGGLTLQGTQCFPSCFGERNQSEIYAGCMVSCTTTCKSSHNWFRSTSLRNVALKAATVLAASYLRREKRPSLIF